ncbi:MAG: endonuclease/exonuclease/phosphatase family protein [Candidatus Krumholzibacteria bacterium]|nr:endonuclease/exonuclease/phosphatase family protein [Candidatus Krumholzibacteria bacterium]
MKTTPIHLIQGPGLFSPLSGRDVTTTGVVIGSTRKGFFVQDPAGDVNEAVSHGIFVLERGKKPPAGSLVEVDGKVVDYQAEEEGRPTTQLLAREVRELEFYGPVIKPVWLTAKNVLVEPKQLATFLNNLEGMLVGIAAGAVFAAPSNPFGDYVVLPAEAALVRTAHGGVLIDPQQPECWLPGFRVLNYAAAPSVNVGAELLEPVTGPLNFRVASFQIAAAGPVRVRSIPVTARPTTLRGDKAAVTVLTLNGFNLDPHREDPRKVNDPRRDVDDDVGDRRFTALGRAIALDAAGPAIVALQEIQDDDGAELTATVEAGQTYAHLIAAVQRAGGPHYEWLDIPPESEADGGQPGGNIRNAYLYDPQRVQYVADSMQRLGDHSPAFADSRKPLTARFRQVGSSGELEVINVHLASKRHQNGLFAPDSPGFDSRAGVRLQQAEVIAEHLARLRQEEVDYYVTGDFNDFEFSPTLRALTGDHSTNLVDSVPAPMRFDYNHRGISQALMHGVVANRQLEGRRAEYEILHANALLGSQPGQTGEKASDHAYVIARLELR